MENQPQTQNLNELQSSIQELRLKNEVMDLSIDLAFKERMYVLLKNFDCDPELLITYLKMNERREVQKLKEFNAKLKARDLELKEKLAERRLNLDERKQTLNEKKFQSKNQDLPDDEALELPFPTKDAPANVVQPQPGAKASFPVKSPASAPRAEASSSPVS